MKPWIAFPVYLERLLLNKKHSLDTVIVLCLFIFAGTAGFSFIKNKNIQPAFYQREFAPAVMQACGKGFVNIDLTKTPELYKFLSLERKHFSCDDLPDEISVRPLNLFQMAHRYLMNCVALNWSLTGISWSYLGLLYFIFSGITIILSYLLMRLACGPAIALAASYFLYQTPLYLNNLPHLRDFSKAPFVYGAILVLSFLLKSVHQRRTPLYLSALYGLIIGIGIGFRMDLILFVPIFIFSILIFLPRGIINPIKTKVYCIAIFLMVTVLSGGPIWKALSMGSNSYHVALLGLMDPFDEALSLERDYYSFGYRYNDLYVAMKLKEYSNRLQSNSRPVRLATPEYNEIGKNYFLTLVRNFPADFLIRAYASALKILTMPYGDLSVVFAVIAFAILLIHDRKLSIFALCIVLFLLCYPAIQFQSRHFFHLLIVPLWLIGIVVQQFFIAIKSIILKISKGNEIKIDVRQNNRNKVIAACAIFFCSTLAIFGSLYLARFYQNRNLQALFKVYLQAPREALNEKGISINGKKELIRFSIGEQPILDNNNLPVESEYLFFRIDSDEPYKKYVTYSIKYKANTAFEDHSYEIKALANTWNFVPVYKVPGSKFEGIIVDKSKKYHFSDFSRIRDLHQLQVLYRLNLPFNVDNLALYQTFLKNRSEEDIIGNFEVDPSEVEFILSHNKIFPLTNSYGYLDPIVRASTNGIAGKGEPLTKNAYLFVSGYATQLAGSFLIAEGNLRKGKLTIGGLRDNQWYTSIQVAKKGPFAIILKLNAANVYPIIAATESFKLDFELTNFSLYHPPNNEMDSQKTKY